jgi:hypothetical protein
MAAPQDFHERFTYETRAQAPEVQAVAQARWDEVFASVKTYADYEAILEALAAKAKSLFVPRTAPMMLIDGKPMLSIPVISITAWNAKMDTTVSAGQYLLLDMKDGVWLPVRVEQVMVSVIDSCSYFAARVVSAYEFKVFLFNLNACAEQLVPDPMGLVHSDTVKVRCLPIVSECEHTTDHCRRHRFTRAPQGLAPSTCSTQRPSSRGKGAQRCVVRLNQYKPAVM